QLGDFFFFGASEFRVVAGRPTSRARRWGERQRQESLVGYDLETWCRDGARAVGLHAPFASPASFADWGSSLEARPPVCSHRSQARWICACRRNLKSSASHSFCERYT